jgi:hypothetical protein
MSCPTERTRLLGEGVGERWMCTCTGCATTAVGDNRCDLCEGSALPSEAKLLGAILETSGMDVLSIGVPIPTASTTATFAFGRLI